MAVILKVKKKVLNSNLSPAVKKPKPSKPKKILNEGLRKTRKITYGPEARVQKALLQYIFLQYPQVFAHVIKIHNEGVRSGVGTFVLKQLGLHPGASDLFVAWPTKRNPGLWLEIKRDGYKPTHADMKHLERQEKFLIQMRSVGYKAEFGIGLDACMLIFDDYVHERKTYESVSFMNWR